MATGRRPRGSAGAANPPTESPETGGPAHDLEAPALETITGYLLRRAHYVFSTYWIAHFRAAGTPITPMQAGVMLMLHRHPLITQSELGRLMGIEAPTAYNLITKLVTSDYIERIQDGADKRAHMLRLTPAGLGLLTPISEAVASRDAELMADFTEAERATLGKLLVRIVLNGHEHLGISQQVVSAAAPDDDDQASRARGRPARASARKWRPRSRNRD